MKNIRICRNCESYMPDIARGVMICANTYYGEPKEETDTCEGFGASLDCYCEYMKAKKMQARKTAASVGGKTNPSLNAAAKRPADELGRNTPIPKTARAPSRVAG